jgi:hypothetical protein
MNNIDINNLDINLKDSWWTGVHPAELFGEDGKAFSLPQLNLASCNREQIFQYFCNTWVLTEILFSGLKIKEAFYRPPYHGLRHPLIFYYGHPAVLTVRSLRLAGILKGSVHSYFESIFEVGVDEMSWDDMSKNEMKWPEIAEVRDYRRQVFELVKVIIFEAPEFAETGRPFLADSAAWALML